MDSRGAPPGRRLPAIAIDLVGVGGASPVPATMPWTGGGTLPATDGAPDADVNKAAELLAAEGPPWRAVVAAGAAAPVPAAMAASPARRAGGLGIRRGSGVHKVPISPALALAHQEAEVARERCKALVAAPEPPVASVPEVVPKTEDEEKAAKYEARLSMNRKSAKASRTRRQAYLKELEKAVGEYERKAAAMAAELERVRLLNAQYAGTIETLRKKLAASEVPAASSAAVPTPAEVQAAAAAAVAATPEEPVLVAPVEFAPLVAEDALGAWADVAPLGDWPDLQDFV